MNTPPRISIVTPSFNQGRFIQETIESVLMQNYPNVEHIVVDGMTTDQTLAILNRYNHLVLVREPDSGQAYALNKGFALATGDILTFINSEDTLLPGTLHISAGELSPTEGKHVISGRCRFVDSHGEFIIPAMKPRIAKAIRRLREPRRKPARLLHTRRLSPGRTSSPNMPTAGWVLNSIPCSRLNQAIHTFA